MKLLIGLGNPGEEYRFTRHNLGYLVVDEFCHRLKLSWSGREGRSWTARGRRAGQKILVAKPGTYMNHSGEAVTSLVAQCGVEPEDLLIICDDITLELGTLRIRPSGSDGGHLGLRSIIERLGTQEVSRLRLGIRPLGWAREELSDFVLEPFGPQERPVVKGLVQQAVECIDVFLNEGIETTMRRYNRRQIGSSDSPPHHQSSQDDSEG